MANNKIREDKICLNCGEHVENKFCPECGQKNTDSRRSFYSLFGDFFTTLLNYDNSFWRTIKTLFASPGKLTKEYMCGKRKNYLQPVQLYLFVSFVVFFIPVILPSNEEDIEITEEMLKENKFSSQDLDEYGFVRSRAHLDSIHFSRPPEERISQFDYYFTRLIIRANKKIVKSTDFETVFKNDFISNLSKAIFIYMPIFAFFLWLFHGKKRWYYFDSGVFTLHFFSLVMLIVTAILIFDTIFNVWLDWEDVFTFICIVAMCYITFYFFRAHHNYFGESTAISRLKATSLVIINTIFMTIVLLIYLILVFMF